MWTAYRFGRSDGLVGSVGTARREPGVVVDEDRVGLRRTPRTAEVRVHEAGLVERRLHDLPRALDDVLAGEPAERTLQGIADQPLVRVLALAERGGEVDVHVDVLAVEMRAPASWPAART